MKISGKVIISANEYLRLLKAEYNLLALECTGVSDWPLYGECPFLNQKEEQRIIRKVLQKVNTFT